MIRDLIKDDIFRGFQLHLDQKENDEQICSITGPVSMYKFGQCDQGICLKQ